MNPRDAAVEALAADTWHDLRPYEKWEGAHWRLLAAAELGVRDDDRFAPMLDRVLDWLTGSEHRSRIVAVAGRVRRCASQEGNALLAATTLGWAGDPRTRTLASSLVGWQWPDGGWNCDDRPEVAHSSFHETLGPLRGLARYAQATGDAAARTAADRAAEFLLRHRLYRSHRTGAVISPEWLRIHWPAYWHYDVLQGLRGLEAVGLLDRSEAADALDWLEGRRRPDGTWRVSRRYWRPAASGRGNEVVDWTTFDVALVAEQARGVLAAAGRAA